MEQASQECSCHAAELSETVAVLPDGHPILMKSCLFGVREMNNAASGVTIACATHLPKALIMCIALTVCCL